MTDLTTILAELEEAERAAKLTGDQWTVGYENIGPADNTRLVAFLYDGDSEDGPIICIDEEPNGEDLPSPALHFIALMRTHLPALIAAAKRVAEDEWRPIETARDELPDRRSRLIYVPANQCTYCVSWGDQGWEIFGAACYRDILQSATHWRPLPTPPRSHP